MWSIFCKCKRENDNLVTTKRGWDQVEKESTTAIHNIEALAGFCVWDGKAAKANGLGSSLCTEKRPQTGPTAAMEIQERNLITKAAFCSLRTNKRSMLSEQQNRKKKCFDQETSILCALGVDFSQ